METVLEEVKVKTLGEISTSIQYGFTASASIENVGPKFLRITDIQDGNVNWDTVPFCLCDNPEKYLLGDGDIVFARTGATTGKSFMIENAPKAVFASYLIRLRLKPKFFPKFVYYFFQSAKYWREISKNIVGSTQGGFNASKLSDIEISIPDFKTQKKIAETLQQIDVAIQKRKQANQLTEQFLQSTFIEMFGDPETNPKNWSEGIINDVVEYSEYGTSYKSNHDKLGYPVLGMSNISYDGQLDLSKINFVELNNEDFKKLKLEKGDIIFNRTNSTDLVGKTTYWNHNIEAVLASYLVKLRLNKKFNPICFSFLLNSSYFKKIFMKRCKKAVGQSNISPTFLKEFPIYIPPLPLQKKFATLAEQVEKLRTKQKESEKELENLFQSLMQKYFG